TANTLSKIISHFSVHSVTHLLIHSLTHSFGRVPSFSHSGCAAFGRATSISSLGLGCPLYLLLLAAAKPRPTIKGCRFHPSRSCALKPSRLSQLLNFKNKS